MRWHYGPLPTTLLETSILLSLAVFLWESRSQWRSITWRSPLLWCGLLFLFAGALAVVTAPSRVAALGLYRAYLVEPMAFGLAVMNVVRNANRALLIVTGLFVGATVAGLANTVVVVLALVQHRYQVTETPPVVIYSTANAVALYTVPLVAMAGSLALYAAGRARLIGLVFFVVGVVVTLTSFSRGGYAALAASVFILAMTHRRRFVLLAAGVVVAAALALVHPVRQRVLIETQNVYGNTIQSRLDLWSAAINLIKARPIFGAGLSGFPERIKPYFTHLHTQANFIDPHNIVLNFWVETGVLGVIAFAWILVVGFRLAATGWRVGTEEWKPYHLGVFLALIAVVVHGLVDVPYFKNDLSLEFWTLLALTAAGSRWDAKSAAGLRRAA